MWLLVDATETDWSRNRIQVHGVSVEMDDTGRRWIALVDGLDVGRGTPADGAPRIQVRADSVARRHCQFRLTEGQWMLLDKGSTGGTFVDRGVDPDPEGACDTGPSIRVTSSLPLAEGDRVQLGASGMFLSFHRARA